MSNFTLIRRCMSLRNRSSLPGMCTIYYDDETGYFSGSTLSGLQNALQRISDMFQNISDNNQCVELMTNYLCHYYFPLCDRMTDRIIPVCNRSCALIGNNENCSALRDIANEQLGQDNIIPPGETCLQTYRSFVNLPLVSGDCLAIEENLNETLPLTCLKVPSDDSCQPLVTYSFYAPAAFEVTPALSNEIETIIRQLDVLDPCRAFISTLNCILRFPPCDPTAGRVLPICQDRCPTVDRTVAECSSVYSGNDLEFPAFNELATSFVCTDPGTYLHVPLQYVHTVECLLLLASNMTFETNNGDSSDNDMIIIITVPVSFVIVVAVIILITTILCMKRRSKSKRKSAAEDIGVRFHSHNQHSLNLRYPSNESSPYLTPHGRSMKEDNLLKASKSSLLLEVNQFLDYVQNKFSEVLLPVDTVIKQGLLGKGAFGVVHKGELVSSDGSVKAVAIKTIKSCSLDAMKDLVAESFIMKTFHHPNVLPLLGVCIDYDDEDVLKIVIPFMANGDLKIFLKDSRVSPNNTQEYPKDLSEEKLLRMCFDIAKGMEYLATKRFIHRDLAARNCMVDNFLSIKIADFGLAKDVYSTEYYRIEKHTTLPVKWMAMESILDGYFDEKTDVWSYGITCWEIFSLGRIPYPAVDNSNIITLLKTGERLEKPDLCPLEMNELISSTWIEDPDKRPTFAAIVQQLSRNFTIASEIEEHIKDTEETMQKNSYISILPK